MNTIVLEAEKWKTIELDSIYKTKTSNDFQVLYSSVPKYHLCSKPVQLYICSVTSNKIIIIWCYIRAKRAAVLKTIGFIFWLAHIKYISQWNWVYELKNFRALKVYMNSNLWLNS